GRYTGVAAPRGARTALRDGPAQLADAGRDAGPAQVVELQPRQQPLPRRQVVGARRRLHPGPDRLEVVNNHDRLAQPRLQPLALAHDPQRLRARQQRAGVALGGVADVAGREQALDVTDVGVHVAREPVALGVDPRPEQLAQARDLDTDAARRA